MGNHTKNLQLNHPKGSPAMSPRYPNRTLLILVTLLFISACASQPQGQKAPDGSAGGINSTLASTADLKAQDIDAHVRDFTDMFISRMAPSYAYIAANPRTPEERTWALQNRLFQGMAALSDATGPDPSENLLDIVVLVTAQRMAIEEYWIPNLLHDDGKDLLIVYQENERDAWAIASRVFTDEQVLDLHRAIADWKKANPKALTTGFIKFSDFLGSSSASHDNAQNVPPSLLSLLYIDPLAGLDPITEEAHGFRVLGERLAFVAMRLPIVLNWQIDAATDRIVSDPQIQRVISLSAEYAKVGNRFDDIAAGYPKDFSKLTEAAIAQISAAGTAQRQALLKTLNSESDQVHGILADARNSIILARDTSASINSNTSQTISTAEAGGQRILREAMFFAISLVIIGFLWPAVVLFAYRYASQRWLRSAPLSEKDIDHVSKPA
jgi:hypothetical protein